MEQTQNKYKSLLSVLFVFAIIFGFAFAIPMTAYADEVESEQLRPDEIIEESFFVGFKKGETEERGKYMIGCYYVPNSVYQEDYLYGTVVFPSFYEDKYGVHDDYIRLFAELNVGIVNVVAQSIQEVPDGYIVRNGMAKIKEKNADIEFTYVFYITDQDGNTAYLEPQHVTYNTLNAKDLSDEEILDLLDEKLLLRTDFGQITVKISELVDSVWIYLVIALGSVVVIWGAYIGIRIAVAKKNEQKIDAKAMVKRLVIGIIVMFVMAGGLPLLIKGLAAWTGG